jgi:hypothetical protein
MQPEGLMLENRDFLACNFLFSDDSEQRLSVFELAGLPTWPVSKIPSQLGFPSPMILLLYVAFL